MLAHTRRAELTVRVPRGAAGDLEGGLRSVLERVDCVEAVAIDELCGVRPDALDCYVDARISVAFADDADDPERLLREGFGVVEAAVDTSEG